MSIHIGQAGIQIGQSVWELYCLEHGVHPDGTLPEDLAVLQYEGFSSFFTEIHGKFVPIALMIDLEPSIVDEIRRGPMRDLYNPRHLMAWNEDAANNFARGYMTIGEKMIDNIMNVINRCVDNCESLQGFLVFHSVAGGTGSGLGSLLAETLNDNYGKKSKHQFSLYPAPKVSKAIVEPYNSVLTTHTMLDNCGCTFIADNEALYNMTQIHLDIDFPSYRNLNRIIAQVYSAVTGNLRFDGPMNVDLNEFETNLVPFPRVHFPLLSYAPILNRNSCTSSSIAEITRSVFGPHNQLIQCNTQNGKYLSCCLLYRGNVISQDVNQAIHAVKAKKNIEFVQWSPTGFKVGINFQIPSVIPEGELAPTERAVCMLANTTSIVEALIRINKKFDLMFSKRAFLHWYSVEGLEKEYFIEARENLSVLEKDYEEINSDPVKAAGEGFYTGAGNETVHKKTT